MNADEAPPMPEVTYTLATARIETGDSGIQVVMRINTEIRDPKHWQALMSQMLWAAERAAFDYETKLLCRPLSNST